MSSAPTEVVTVRSQTGATTAPLPGPRCGRPPPHAGVVHGILEEDHESVAADPRHRVGRPTGLLQTGRHSFQDIVTGAVPVAVVQFLEAVEIAVEQSDLAPLPGRAGEGVGQAVQEHPRFGRRVTPSWVAL